ncbi:MAG: RES family NAD+ phosphorylase [Nevskia sp.]|nr:RES family NAD+ phosphorylase [Nevskia sp.]
MSDRHGAAKSEAAAWSARTIAKESQRCELHLWRAVEAQHVVATRALVDSQAEQELLEELLDAAKPAVPADCARLDYLLYTPFRYPSVGCGSRFRALSDPGVWYGAEEVRTACAEAGYWRWRFVTDSRGLKRLDGVPHTVFQAAARGATVDLRRKPFVREAARWSDPDDYAACQAFARAARQAAVKLIRYRSVRDPAQAGCAAVLDCRAFCGTGGVRRRQTWFLTVDSWRVSWRRAGGAPRKSEGYEFVFGPAHRA